VKHTPLLSIGIPVYKGSSTLQDAIDSILCQKFQDYEIVISDDNNPNDIEEIKRTTDIIKSYKDKRLAYVANGKNLGCQKNIQKLVSLSRSNFLTFLCQDDVLLNNVLEKIYNIFKQNKNVGIITRPYYWFDDDPKIAIRTVHPYDNQKDTLIKLSNEKAFYSVINSVGQLSGLAYRKNYLSVPFKDDVFTGHIYPFLGVWKNYDCFFLKNFSVAVRTNTSQTRSISSIYDVSPTYQWAKMFDEVFSSIEYRKFSQLGISYMAKHYEGLIQLKCYAKRGVLEKEIMILIKYRIKNILSIKFWSYVILTILTPPTMLSVIVKKYKQFFMTKKVLNYK